MNRTEFYGRKGLNKAKCWKERLKRVEHEFSAKPALPQYRPRLDSPSAKWKIFYRQNEAFQFARSQSKELHVFAFESDMFQQKGGQRLYLVASLEHFWHYYQSMRRHQRHHYEIIPEGAVCRLYFDLEFPRETNPARNGEHAVAILIKYVCAQLKKVFKVSCSEKDVLILDASTNTKFSQHLIFHIKGAAFKCNVTAGNFVHFIMRQVLEVHARPNKCKVDSPPEAIPSQRKDLSPERMETGLSREQELTADETFTEGAASCTKRTESTFEDFGISAHLFEAAGINAEDLRELLVCDKDGKETLISDLGVYTKNRNFRLYLSCKMGKDNPLLVAAQSEFCPPPNNERIKCKYVKPSSQQQTFMDSLVTETYVSGLRILTFTDLSKHHQTYHPTKKTPVDASDVLEGFESSPYPEVDAFISEQAKHWGQGPPGYVRQWIYFSHGEILIYNIAKNNWCGRMGRCHKSNKIMLIADLKNRVFYQKCHDPDCKALNYKSPDQPLPPHVLPSVFVGAGDAMSEFDIDADDWVDDDELVQAASQVEAQMLEFSDDDEELLTAVQELESSPSS